MLESIKRKLRKINLGKKRPPWFSAFIKAANTGKVRTLAMRARYRAAAKNRQPISVKTRLKMSKAHKGKKLTQEWKDKIAASVSARLRRRKV